MEGGAEPEAGADLEFQIGKPSGSSRRCGKNPGPGPRATAGGRPGAAREQPAAESRGDELEPLQLGAG